MKLRSIARLFLICCLSVVLCNFSVAAADEVTVTLDGQRIQFDQPPVIQEGRVLVPFRAVFEAIGMNVQFNSENKVVEASDNTYAITMQIDSYDFQVKKLAGDETKSDRFSVPPQIINGRTLIPINAVLTALDYNVSWNGETKTVIITSPGASPAAPAAPITSTAPASLSNDWKSKYMSISPSTFYTSGSHNLGRKVSFSGKIIEIDIVEDAAFYAVTPTGESNEVFIITDNTPDLTLKVGDTANFYCVYFGLEELDDKTEIPVFLAVRIVNDSINFAPQSLIDDFESASFEELNAFLSSPLDLGDSYSDEEYEYISFIMLLDSFMLEGMESFILCIEGENYGEAKSYLEALISICKEAKEVCPAPTERFKAVHQKIFASVDNFINMCEEYLSGLNNYDIDALNRADDKFSKFVDQWLDAFDDLWVLIGQ